MNTPDDILEAATQGARMTLADNLTHLPARLATIAKGYAAALQTIDDAIELCDGYPTSVIGAGEPTATRRPPDPDADVHLNPVESAANRVGPLMTEQMILKRTAREILRLTNHLEILVNRRTPKADATGEACNQGTGRDGVIEWGDPLCRRIRAGDRGGMCDACAKREYRWRQAHDLAPRERDAA